MGLQLAIELLVAVVPAALLAWVAFARGRRLNDRYEHEHHGGRLHRA